MFESHAVLPQFIYGNNACLVGIKHNSFYKIILMNCAITAHSPVAHTHANAFIASVTAG